MVSYFINSVGNKHSRNYFCIMCHNSCDPGSRQACTSVELSERERTVGLRLRDFLSYDCREVLNSLTVTLLWGREGLSLICTNVIPRQRGLLSVYIYRTICLWVHAQLSFLSFSPNKPTLFCNIAGGVHPASLHIPDLSIWLSSFPLSSDVMMEGREKPG